MSRSHAHRALAGALAAALLMAACSRPAPSAAPASGGPAAPASPPASPPASGGPTADAGAQPSAREPATAGPSSAGTAAPGPSAVGPSAAGSPAGAPGVPGFTNRIWKVARSSDNDSGTYYVFLSDGSMLITSPHGTPSLGSWRYSGEMLTLIEEGLPHPATVLRATPESLAIRIAGPGQPVLITFVPATAR